VNKCVHRDPVIGIMIG